MLKRLEISIISSLADFPSRPVAFHAVECRHRYQIIIIIIFQHLNIVNIFNIIDVVTCL